MKTAQQGFTLIELMIVVAIVAILAGIGLPSYQKYTKRAEFAEIIAATGPIKTAVELCAQLEGITAFADSSAGCGKPGKKGIPADITTAIGKVKSTEYKFTSNKAVITAKDADDITYTLTASVSSGRVSWTPGGTCSDEGYC